MSNFVSIRHEDQRAISSADQVELQAIQAGAAVTNVGVRDEQISGEADELAISDGDMMRFHREDVILDDEIGAVRDEVVRRIALMGEAYPFRLDGNLLQYSQSASGFYEYCLGICFAPSVVQKPYVQLPRSFERLTAMVVRKHLGPNWQSFHIGWPRDRSAGTTFLKAVDTLSQLSSDRREWVYSAELGYNVTPKRGGDEGMDFVVWRPAIDKRVGQIYVVAQCACGNDWDTKFSELAHRRLGSYFRPPSHVEFVRSFVTPFMLAPGNFLMAHRDAGWTLDRARLSMMAHEIAADGEYGPLIPEIRSLYELARRPLEKGVPARETLA